MIQVGRHAKVWVKNLLATVMALQAPLRGKELSLFKDQREEQSKPVGGGCDDEDKRGRQEPDDIGPPDSKCNDKEGTGSFLSRRMKRLI